MNTADFFLSHRLPIAQAARDAGYEVHVASAPGQGVPNIVELGFVHHTISFSRSGQSLLREIGTLVQLVFLFMRLRPHLAHLITIKPVLYGGIAARLSRVQAVVAAVSGLGTVFTDKKGLLSQVRRRLVSRLYSLAFRRHRLSIIFQNPDDRDVLYGVGAFRYEQAKMIRGSGVYLTDYPFLPEPRGVPVVTMAARLLRDKGVFEFVEAANILRARNVNVRMRLIGAPDPGNPTTISQAELDQWRNEGLVEFLGYRTDVAAQYAAANLVCLPSYREGLPKGLVEAAACGRAVVTTDVPGCRDAIEPGKTGLLVPVRDAAGVADAIEELIANPEKRHAMGAAGRQLAEKEFAIDKIVVQHLEIYEELMADD